MHLYFHILNKKVNGNKFGMSNQTGSQFLFTKNDDRQSYDRRSLIHRIYSMMKFPNPKKLMLVASDMAMVHSSVELGYTYSTSK